MNTVLSGLTIAALLSSPAIAQNIAEDSVERVLRFTHTETYRDVQEISTVIRSVAEIRNVTVDGEQKSAAVRAGAAQVALAEWMAAQLDRTAGQSDTPNAQEYRLPGGGDDVVRVFFFPKAETVQELQELTVAVRSLAEIRRAFTYNRPRGAVVRGTASEIRMAAWLFHELGGLSAGAASREYRVADGGDDMLRIFHAKYADSVEDLQQLSVVVRSTTEIRRAFTLNKPRAILLRAAAADIALADWLLAALDQPESGATAATKEYRLPGNDDVVAVFYLERAGSPEQLQQLAASIRKTTQLRRMFLYDKRRAVVARGTAAEIATASRLFKESN